MKYNFNYRLKRLRVKFRRFKRNLGNSLKTESNQTTSYEEKSMKLWLMVLRNENSQLAHNSDGVRQIDKNNLFMTMNPHQGTVRYTMTIMDITDKRRGLYELHLEGKDAKAIIDAFDNEMARRMRKVEYSKRTLIESDLDKLIEEETKNEEKKKKKEKPALVD